jgi:penicillin-binding protein 1A
LKTSSPKASTLETYKHPDWAVPPPGDYVHALVTAFCRLKFTPASARPARPGSSCCPEDWKWTGQRYGDALVKPGDIIYVHLADAAEGGARRAALEQDSGAQGSLMAMDNTTGDVLAMVGGRDYALSSVQPRHPGRAPDRLQLQALRLHRRH